MSDNNQSSTGTIPLKKADFISDQEVRWCPGCGDYAILAQVQKVLPDLGIPKEKYVFISGIGCSSRFPYYMNTYGMHSIHGRAPAFATGVKLANPDLSVWVVTGDGDGLSIGGNHLLHVMRRNVDLKIILFNNRIYGLTKGQYSPTSELGKRTKSSPYGTIEHPINPISFALAAEATFIARTFDSEIKHMGLMLEAMAKHKGVAFLEVFQNCVIFNDGAFDNFTGKDLRPDRVLYLENGKPMIFGKEKNKGITMKGLHPEVATLGENGASEKDILVHDTKANPAWMYLLSQMELPEYPVPIGVFRQIERPTYDGMLVQQIASVRAKKGEGNLQDLLEGEDTWTVEE